MALEDPQSQTTEDKISQIDIKKFPKIASVRFRKAKKIFGVLEAKEWLNAIELCWDENVTEFVGWAEASNVHPSDSKDIVVLFRRKSDGREYWFHSNAYELVILQKYL